MADLESATTLVEEYISTNELDATKPLLHALLTHAPTDQGKHNICMRILECKEVADDKILIDKGLRALAEWYKWELLVPMKMEGQRSIEHSAQEYADQESFSDVRVEGGIPVRQRDARSMALRRDNYRSLICRRVDYDAALWGLVRDVTETTFTEAVHILPFVRANTEAKLWTVLENFSGWDIATTLSGDKINRLENILTLTVLEHSVFARLIGWLEPIPGKSNAYYTCGSRDHYDYPAGKVVSFRTTDPKLPLPDHRFIAIHAACAKVLETSGELVRIDHYMRGLDGPELPANGNSETLVKLLKATEALSNNTSAIHLE